MTHLEEYHDLIVHNEIVVGFWIRKQIENLIRDLQDGRYIYDTTEADKRIKFKENLCFQSKKPFYKKPMVLMPWQKAWWEALYSFKYADTGLRRFVDGLLEIARKNGKSTDFSGDIMYDLFVGEGADIAVASNDEKQAKIIFNETGSMRNFLDPHSVLTRQSLVELKNPSRRVTVFRMTNKMQNKDGRLCERFYLDESHECSEENHGNEIADAGIRSMSTVDEPLFLECSTQGYHRDCWLDHRIAKAKSVILGEAEDDRLLAFLFEQDSEQEVWQNEASWEKSNPSLRYGIKKIDTLRRNVEEAKLDKGTRIKCLTKDFNIPQSSSESWLMLEEYDYPQTDFDISDFAGSYGLGSVDLSATTDLTCAKLLLMKPGDRTKYVKTMYFIPESKLTESDDREAGAQYREWARQGLVTICEGNEVDIPAVADWFYSFYRDYRIKTYVTGYDQRFARSFIDRMDYYGFKTEMLAQGRNLSGAMKLTEAELRSKVINYGGNAVDKWCLSNCCCKVDNTGNIQPVKVAGKPSKRIDGAVTLIMLIETYRRYKNDYLTLIGG